MVATPMAVSIRTPSVYVRSDLSWTLYLAQDTKLARILFTA